MTIIAVIAVAIVVAVWMALKPSGPGAGFVCGNGRIEATEIDVATKLAGRVQNIMVNEGDFVQAGQPLAQMQVDVLDAQRDEARAQSRQAVNTVATDEAQVAALQSVTAAAQATLKERESDLDIAQRTLARSEKLAKVNAVALNRSTKMRVRPQRIRCSDSRSGRKGCHRGHRQGGASPGLRGPFWCGRHRGDRRPRRGRYPRQPAQIASRRPRAIPYRPTRRGLRGGGKVLNLVDLSDVYMTFFLPETAVGKVCWEARRGSCWTPCRSM